jgi:hypothetical protein
MLFNCYDTNKYVRRTEMNRMIIAGLVLGAMAVVGCNASKPSGTTPSSKGIDSYPESDGIFPISWGSLRCTCWWKANATGTRAYL